MKQKIFIVLVCLVIIGTLILISKKFNNIEINNEYVVMEVSDIFDDKILITLNNISEETCYYGNFYLLQVYENEKWTTLDSDLVFTAEAYTLESYDKVNLTIYIDNYDDLSSGIYRIIKEISIKTESKTVEETINISAEFEIK